MESGSSFYRYFVVAKRTIIIVLCCWLSCKMAQGNSFLMEQLCLAANDLSAVVSGALCCDDRMILHNSSVIVYKSSILLCQYDAYMRPSHFVFSFNTLTNELGHSLTLFFQLMHPLDLHFIKCFLLLFWFWIVGACVVAAPASALNMFGRTARP